MNISAAIEEPRFHSQVVPNVTTIEVGPGGPPEKVLKGLKVRGHVIGEFDINLGVAESKSSASFALIWETTLCSRVSRKLIVCSTGYRRRKWDDLGE